MGHGADGAGALQLQGVGQQWPCSRGNDDRLRPAGGGMEFAVRGSESVWALNCVFSEFGPSLALCSRGSDDRWRPARGRRGVRGPGFGVWVLNSVFSEFGRSLALCAASSTRFTAPTERQPSSSRGSANNGPAVVATMIRWRPAGVGVEFAVRGSKSGF